MRFCKDCNHFDLGPVVCLRDAELDPVFGGPVANESNSYSAYNERKPSQQYLERIHSICSIYTGPCGPDAAYFTPKIRITKKP